NGEGRDAREQGLEALAPAPAQTEAQNLLMAVCAANGADDQQTDAQRHQLRRLIVGHLAFEVGDEVEQEADQAEGGFGAVERLQAEAPTPKSSLSSLIRFSLSARLL